MNMRKKLNIGVALNVETLNRNTVKWAIARARKAGLPIRVATADYEKVYNYLVSREEQREARRVALEALSRPVRSQRWDDGVPLRKRFVEALSTPLSSPRCNSYGLLDDSESVKRCQKLIAYLNILAPGRFEERKDFDDKGRGDYVKFSLLLLDHERKLAVIQGRHYLQWGSVEHSTARHNYYLVGLTDEGRTFTHPITGNIAWRLADLWDAGEDWYEAFLRWAYGADSSRLIRQGDVALVRLARKPGRLEWKPVGEVKINRTHRLVGAVLYAVRKERRYVEVPQDSVVLMVHLRGQHNTVQVPPGVYRVEVAYRAPLWRFSGTVVD